MATATSNIILPRDVAATIADKVKDSSTIAKLSAATPTLFAEHGYVVFNGAGEAEVLAEGQKASKSDADFKTVTAKTFRVSTISRVNEEVAYADEDSRLEVISSLQADQAAQIGRALDYVIYHAVNPRTGTALDGYTALSGTAVSVEETSDAAADLDSLANAVSDDYDITGIALSRKFAARLRSTRVKNTGARLFPEVPLNLDAGQVDGIKAATSATVNGRAISKDTLCRAFLGNFDLIKWGLARDITAELIPYGDPDNTGVDLKGSGQVAYRCTAHIAAAVLEPKAFAVLKAKQTA